MKCAPLRFPPLYRKLGEYDASFNSSDAQTRLYRVVGLDPRLVVGIQIFYRLSNASGDAVPTANNTHTLQAIAIGEDGSESVVETLIAAGTAVADSWEYQGIADMLRGTVIMQLTGNQAGAWYVKLTAAPAVGLDDCTIERLYENLKLLGDSRGPARLDVP